jgi:hypothetical protein
MQVERSRSRRMLVALEERKEKRSEVDEKPKKVTLRERQTRPPLTECRKSSWRPYTVVDLGNRRSLGRENLCESGGKARVSGKG